MGSGGIVGTEFLLFPFTHRTGDHTDQFGGFEFRGGGDDKQRIAIDLRYFNRNILYGTGSQIFGYSVNEPIWIFDSG